MTAEHLAKMYGLNYITATDEKSLESGLNQLYAENNKAGILEIFTPTTENDTILKQFFKELV